MSSYVFPGHPGFLESAASEMGLPESAAPAGKIAPLAALANLCAQASLADSAHVGGILAKAAGFRDQIAVALRAAELILADVEAGLARPAFAEPAEVDFPSSTDSPLDPRRSRKGPKTPRDSS